MFHPFAYLVQVIRLLLQPYHNENPILDLYLWQYIAMLIIPLVGWLVASLVFYFTGRFLSEKERGQTTYKKIKRLTKGLAAFWTLWSVMLCIGLETTLWGSHIWIIHAMCGLLTLVFVHRLVNFLFALLENRLQNAYTKLGILQIGKGIIEIIALFTTLLFVSRTFIPYDLGAWLKYLSIGTGTLTAIVALASKDLISNFFGALVIIIGRPFKLGDWIIINNLAGRVQKISMRMTKLQTAAGTMLYIPNSLFVTKSIQNYGNGNYLAIPLEITLPATGEAQFQNFLQAVRALIDNTPELVQAKSHIELVTLQAKTAKFTLHLCTQKMGENQKINSLYQLRQKITELQQKSSLA